MTAGDLTAVAAQMTNIIQLRREDLELQREELDVLDQQRRCRSDILAFRREELALSERRKQQRAEEIAQSERYQQVMSAEMAQAERYRRQQEENVPICHQYLDMAREKTSLLKQSTELRYDGLRADYTPSPDEFTFWDACVLAASILTADYQVYAEPFDVWSFCSESNWFCNKAGCVRLWGPDTYRPQPLWYFVHKVLAFRMNKRAGTGTDMVNHYIDGPGRREQMARFIIRHIQESRGKKHDFCPPYGVSVFDV